MPWGIAQIEAKRWRPADPNHTPSKKKIMVGPTNVQAIKLDDEIKKRKFDPPYLRGLEISKMISFSFLKLTIPTIRTKFISIL